MLASAQALTWRAFGPVIRLPDDFRNRNPQMRNRELRPLRKFMRFAFCRIHRKINSS